MDVEKEILPPQEEQHGRRLSRLAASPDEASKDMIKATVYNLKLYCIVSLVEKAAVSVMWIFAFQSTY
jgi:hypothetical protein